MSDPKNHWDKAFAVAAKDLPSNAPKSNAKTDAPPGKSRGRSLADEEVEDKKHTREMRGVYASKAYKLAKTALAGWGVFLLIAGISNACNGQPMFSDKIVIAVTTGVTVSVLAAFLGVIRGIFPAGNGK
ncbi:MAG: hypothetical protein Q4A98_05935 [Comamonadaceae bacterium]|nr:hypothetical protein [Comamonadaceae bacterium]